MMKNRDILGNQVWRFTVGQRGTGLRVPLVSDCQCLMYVRKIRGFCVLSSLAPEVRDLKVRIKCQVITMWANLTQP
jgi:hypothetical protein